MDNTIYRDQTSTWKIWWWIPRSSVRCKSVQQEQIRSGAWSRLQQSAERGQHHQEGFQWGSTITAKYKAHFGHVISSAPTDECPTGIRTQLRAQEESSCDNRKNRRKRRRLGNTDEVLLVEQREPPQERLITRQSQQTGRERFFSETANGKEHEKSKPSEGGGWWSMSWISEPLWHFYGFIQLLIRWDSINIILAINGSDELLSSPLMAQMNYWIIDWMKLMRKSIQVRMLCVCA